MVDDRPEDENIVNLCINIYDIASLSHCISPIVLNLAKGSQVLFLD